MKNLISLILVFVLFWGQSLQAQKIISAYAGFTATDIKNRADIPLQANMTVSGSNVNCYNITTTDIKNILGESVTGVGALCSSTLVNKWSGFSPREWYIDATVLKNRIKTPYQLGSFAGYHHSAVTPGWMSGYITEFKYISGSTTPQTISVALQGGEINFPAMVSASYAKIVVKESGNVIGSGNLALGGYYGTNPINTYCSVSVSGWTGTKTLTATAYLSNGNADELCVFPGTTAWNITATQRMPPATAVHSDPTDATVIKIVGGSGTLDLAGNYTISISNVTKWDMTPYTLNVTVVAYLYDDTNTLIHTQTVVTNSSLRSFSGYLSRAADYDYRVEFVVKKP